METAAAEGRLLSQPFPAGAPAGDCKRYPMPRVPDVPESDIIRA
jgi:hypothetical protein